jgi:plasmid stabilization system protein ParE
MTHVVVLTDRAHAEMEAAYLWWAEHRSRSQADRWYNAFADAIESLASNPDRCRLARENDCFPCEIRDLNFGIGRRRTHRAVFTIRRDMVLVLAVRHLAQRELSPDDVA